MQIRIKPGVLVKQIQDEAVLLDLDSGDYFSLNELGRRAWALLAATDSLDQVLRSLLAEYDTTEDVLRQDLEQFVDQLVTRGLAERRKP